MASLETTDIFRGAFYLCMGGDLESIRVNGGRMATFFFNGKNLTEYDRAYINGRALVNPVQFREALNRLRDILFEKLRQQERRYENDRKRAHRAHQKRC